MRALPFASVYFDCDSTLTSIEGVDELLAEVPAALREDIARMTREAMEGRRPLADVYEQRLAMLAPRRQFLEHVGALYVQRVTPDAREVVEALQFLGKRVGIVSGGIDVPVRMMARHLGIPETHVHAVPLHFDAAGNYAGFDHASLLWRNGGKALLVDALPRDHHPLCFVGDGATDLEVQGHCELFVGFGGVALRPVVKERAQCWIESPTLAPLLAHVLTDGELEQLAGGPRFQLLLERAMRASA